MPDNSTKLQPAPIWRLSTCMTATDAAPNKQRIRLNYGSGFAAKSVLDSLLQ